MKKLRIVLDTNAFIVSISRKAEAHFTIYNDHANGVDGYNYVKDIFWGVSKGSNHVWARAIQPALNLTFQGGKIFSKQLPRGLVPYFNRQDKLFYEDMKTIEAEYNRRHK